MPEHLIDGALAHAAAFLGLAALAAAIERPTRAAWVAATVLCVAAVLALLAIGTLAFAEVLTPEAVLLVSSGTIFGRSVSVLAAGVALAVALRRWAFGARMGVAVGAVGLVWLGHGGSKGELSLEAALQLVHVGALLAWVAGLIGVTRGLLAGEGLDAARAFSRRALPQVLVAVTSGVALTATYARPTGEGLPWLVALGLKLVVVAAALGCALYARGRLRAGDREGLERVLEAEWLGVLAAIGLAGLLSQLPPP